MENSLHLVLILLAAAVLVVILFRLLKLPAMIGYLLVGIIIGPHSLGLIPDTAGTQYLAEIGVVFLMFSIGLEFSLAKLTTMRRIVFGLGASQVVLTLAGVVAGMVAAGADWRTGLVLGGVVAMSSTAIVSKMLADKLELNTLRHHLRSWRDPAGYDVALKAAGTSVGGGIFRAMLEDLLTPLIRLQCRISDVHQAMHQFSDMHGGLWL